MNACSGNYAAGLAARMGDEGEAFERRQESLTDEILSDREELETVVWDALATDAADKVVTAILNWYAVPNASVCADGTADARARKAITDAISVMVEKAVDERVNALLRNEGWGV